MREAWVARIRRILLVGIIALIPTIPLLLLLGMNAGASSSEAVRVERLQPLNTAQLRDMPVGTEVLVEGRISDATLTRMRAFVAYVQERHYLDADLSDTWREEERVASPFVLDMPDGRVEIVNSSYRLVNPTAVWIAPGTPSTNPMRYTGFELGDRVVVIGRLTQAANGIAIRADTVIGGTRDAFLAAQRGSLSFSILFGGVLVLFVLAMLATVYVVRQRATHATPLRKSAEETP